MKYLLELTIEIETQTEMPEMSITTTDFNVLEGAMDQAMANLPVAGEEKLVISYLDITKIDEEDES